MKTNNSIDTEEGKRELMHLFGRGLNTNVLRENGCKVKATHFRYRPEDMELLRRQVAHARAMGARIVKDDDLLTSTFELRAEHDLKVDQQKVGPNANYMSANGGEFLIEVEVPGVKDSFVASAVCSINDNYRRKSAHKIALQRLFHNMCCSFGLDSRAVRSTKAEKASVLAA